MERQGSAFLPHKFRKSRFDDNCECRMPRNYRLHQSWLWRLLHPRRKTRVIREWIPRRVNKEDWRQGFISPNKKIIIRWGGEIFLVRMRVRYLEFLVRRIRKPHEGWRDGT